MTKAAFVLSAGFGTRFKPQSLFVPKPALPFFNLPQALYPTSLLKKCGVKDFYYNSHHLPQKLDEALEPYFKRKSIYEHEILDSAGGIANARSFLKDYENFWVVNGDSLVLSTEESVFQEAYDYHIKSQSLVTLLGIPQDPKAIRSGLCFDTENRLTGIRNDISSLHFVGFYLFNKEIFNFIKPQKSHIFKDALLKIKSERISVFNLKNTLSWYESGNEKDFITAIKQEGAQILELKKKSPVFHCHTIWEQDSDKTLEHFLKHKVWGRKEIRPPHLNASDFLIVPDKTTGDFTKVKNCVFGENLVFKSSAHFDEKVLVHPAQWTN